MTTQNYHPASRYHRHCQDHKNKRFIIGALVIIIGAVLLGKRLGLFFLPFHVWPLILIAIGLYTGLKHNFRHFGSWLLIILGIAFMIPKFLILGVWSTHLVAPLLLITLGTFIILKPRRKRFGNPARFNTNAVLDDSVIYLTASFGEKNVAVTSKNFKGGTINNTFSETKLNLMQADNTEPMELEVSVSFGSVDILVPEHWDVDFQVTNSFASVEDKRYMRVMNTEEKRTLTITGNCSFGSITVKSL